MSQQEELYRINQTIQVPTPKYLRRPEIDFKERSEIAIKALDKKHGTITNLAKDYEVSRQFIYNLCNQLLLSAWLLFGQLDIKEDNREEKKAIERLHIDKEILILRLEGKCSLESISKILKRGEKSQSSIGYISELLKRQGKQLNSTLTIAKGVSYALIFASDEVYSKGKPVLITVDPKSSAILRIELSKDRKSKSWKKHWEGILNASIQPIYITNDEGSGMEAARKKLFLNVNRQSDTFHAVALNLGDIVRVLENQAYKAIEDEYECERLLQGAKSDKNKSTRKSNRYSAAEKAKDLIKLYEDYIFWYVFMIEQFQIFDKKGQLLDATQAEENLKLSLEEIGKLDRYNKSQNEKMKKLIAKIYGLLPNLFHFLKHAKTVVDKMVGELSSEEEKAGFYAICAAYQHNKNASKAKTTKARKYCSFKEEEELICAQILLENTSLTFDKFKAYVYDQLQNIVQSSAMVETINSIVRSYFNCSKNQITQEGLNLIMFYHNHKKYTRGKRKGKSPMELLTGKEQQEDWLDLLLAETSKLTAQEQKIESIAA